MNSDSKDELLSSPPEFRPEANATIQNLLPKKSQNKYKDLRLCEGKNLSGTVFTEAASKVPDKLHKNINKLFKKSGPQISLARPRTFYNPDKEYWFLTAVVGSNKKLGYNEFDTIDASKIVNRQVTEIGVHPSFQGVIKSLIEYLDCLEHRGGEEGVTLVFHNFGAESFQFGSFRAKYLNVAMCLSNMLATKISHNVKDIINEFCPCVIETTVSNNDCFNLKKINLCLTVAPQVCKPPVVSRTIFFNTYGVYPFKYQSNPTCSLHKNIIFNKMSSGTTKTSSFVFMGINHSHKSKNIVNCNCKNCLAKATSIRYKQNSCHSQLILDLRVLVNKVYTTLWQNSFTWLYHFQKPLSQYYLTNCIAYWIIFNKKINLIMASFIKGNVQHR